MNTKTVQKLGGFCSISLGLIYIIAFIVYGGILDYPKGDTTEIEKQEKSKNELTNGSSNFQTRTFNLLSICNFVINI